MRVSPALPERTRANRHGPAAEEQSARHHPAPGTYQRSLHKPYEQQRPEYLKQNTLAPDRTSGRCRYALAPRRIERAVSHYRVVLTLISRKITYLTTLRGVNISPVDYRVLITLLTYADADGTRAFPSAKELAKACHMNLKTVPAALKRLEQRGLITCVKRSKGGPGCSTRWEINEVPQLPGEPEEPPHLAEGLSEIQLPCRAEGLAEREPSHREEELQSEVSPVEGVSASEVLSTALNPALGVSDGDQTHPFDGSNSPAPRPQPPRPLGNYHVKTTSINHALARVLEVSPEGRPNRTRPGLCTRCGQADSLGDEATTNEDPLLCGNCNFDSVTNARRWGQR